MGVVVGRTRAGESCGVEEGERDGRWGGRETYLEVFDCSAAVRTRCHSLTIYLTLENRLT
jgi:hypothetical protein